MLSRLAGWCLITGCAATPNATSPPPIPPTDLATIVFVRVASECDSDDEARIVDESGRFVAALPADASFAIPVQPIWYAGSAPRGAVFYVWPSVDLFPSREPTRIGPSPVGVLRVHPNIRGPTYISIVRHPGCADRKTFEGGGFRLLAIEPVRKATPIRVNPTVGQAALERDGEVTRRYLELARQQQTSAERMDRSRD